MKRFAVAALVLLVVPSLANASWQYTKWGMTPAQVTAASKGTTRETTAEEKKGGKLHGKVDAPLLAAPWKSGAFEFTATFYFSPKHGLSLVVIQLDSGDPDALLGSLRAKYGKAFSSSEDAIMTSEIWHAGKDQVAYMKIGDHHTTVQYSPLVSADNIGL